MSRELRTARRVPVTVPARIRSLHGGSHHYGTCTDLSVNGMTLHSSFVPRPDEVLEVTVLPPRAGKVQAQPMVAKVRVRRCHELERGKTYEIGAEIIEIID